MLIIDMIIVGHLGSIELAAVGLASTGNDGKQYFVPWTYYIWGCYYRPSVFEENGWTPPTNRDWRRTWGWRAPRAAATRRHPSTVAGPIPDRSTSRRSTTSTT